jgi:hypothetical protein
MMARGLPDGLDADTSQRVRRTFLLVRIVRGSLLLLFLAIAGVGVEVRGWPSAVTVAIVLAMVVQTAALVVWCRQYASAGKGGSRHVRWP